jgi:cell fate regulator YaaT (PSP1 superfamily)
MNTETTPTPTPATEQTSSKQGPRFIVAVRLMGGDKSETCDPGEMHLRVGTHVIVDFKRGDRIGVIASNKIVNLRKDMAKPLPRILRIATPADLEASQRREQIEDKASLLCLEKIAKLNLAMNLSRVVYIPDVKKTVFYFTAEGRVDFRELVKELAQNLKSKIEMKQVGVRDEAKAITGYGVCGESLCCSTFLKEFFPVTVRMAKDQGLALNPSKISGACGRLMCCLQYEHDIYRELIKAMPKPNSRLETPEGPGKALKNDILLQKVTVRLDDESIVTYHVTELNIPPKRVEPNIPQKKGEQKQNPKKGEGNNPRRQNNPNPPPRVNEKPDAERK